jgi:hypothetical protein
MRDSCVRLCDAGQCIQRILRLPAAANSPTTCAPDSALGNVQPGGACSRCDRPRTCQLRGCRWPAGGPSMPADWSAPIAACPAPARRAGAGGIITVWLPGRAVLPAMRARRYGRIVHRPPPGRSACATAKSAQIGLALSWAREPAPSGITVNTVAPGFIPVERHADVPAGVKEAYLASVPAGRMGTPGDIAPRRELPRLRRRRVHHRPAHHHRRRPQPQHLNPTPTPRRPPATRTL